MATKPGAPQKAGQKQGVGQEKGTSQPWQSALDAARDAYYSLEDRYYSLLDYLEDERGIPVYEKFVEPVESAKIPSFPVAALLLIVTFSALLGVASLALAPNTATVTINLVSTDGGPVSEANVTLFVDNADTGTRIASRVSNYSGMAVFEKVPLGVSLFVTVVAPDYKDYMQPLESLSRDAPFAQLELEPVSSSDDANFKVLVRDDSNLPVLGATVTAHTVTGTLLEDGVQLTNAFGAAQFSLPTRVFLAIDVEKEGYESVYGRIVDASRFLTEAVTIAKKTDSFKARPVKVIATAANSTGGAVSAEVSLYTIAGSELGKKRTQDGRVSFEVPQGTEFYISATATSNDTARYFEYYSNRLVAQDDINEFALTFVSKAEGNSTNSTCGTLRIQVQNESQAPLSGEVFLYSELANAYVAHKQAQSGSATFDLCADSTLYAAAYSPGYFAANALGLRPGASATVTLRAVTRGNNGSAQVTTLDADARTPVSGAVVSMLDSNNRFLAYPKQSTNADGRAEFSGLELGASHYAFADKPSKNAKSALFSVPEGASAKVTIVFGNSMAKIAVAPVDVLTGRPIDAVATAKAGGMPSVSCQVRTSNTTACELAVYSGVPVTVEVTSSGYEKLISSPFLLSESEGVRYVASMLPSSLKDQFTVKYSGLYDSKGNLVSSIERGGQYDAKFIVNIPTNASAYKAGFILRIGTAGFDNRSAIDPLEHFVIIPKQYPQVPVNLMSYSYKPAVSCTLDIRNSSNAQGYYKWAYYLLDNASGVREVLARVLVRDNAYTDEKLRVSSSAWYSPTGAADSYLHVPSDSDFGSSNRSAARDWCYAKSDYRDYSVQSGKSYCGANACASLGFFDSDSNQTSQYKGIIGRPFFAEARFDLLRAVLNPRVVIYSTSQKARIHGYNVSTDVQNLSGDAGAKTGIELNLTQFYATALVRLNVTFSDKADFSAFYADLYDGSSRVARAYGYVTESGVGRLRITVAPERLTAAGTYALNISLTDYYSSSPVEDALITLNETNGTAFSGRKYSVLGGSVSDPLQGVSGNYRISGVFATQKGAFDLVTNHPDYLDAKKQVVVDGLDFLSVGTSDIEACGEDNQVIVYNSHVLDANVSVTASKSGCINVTGFAQMRNGTDASWTDNTSQIIRSGLTYFLPLGFQGQGRITITPASWDKTCAITLAASARDGSQSTRAVSYQNCKESAFSEFLSVSPSRVSNTAGNGKCNRAAVVNISNTLPAPGSVSVQVSAPGLLVETGGANQSLSTPFLFAVPRAGTASLLMYPMTANSTVLMTFNATDGSRNASVTIPFDNCPLPTREAAPDIVSYSPNDYARITTDRVPALVTVDTYAYCRIGPSNVAAKQLPYLLSQKASSGGNYDYGTDLVYNKGSGTPFVFSTGRNTAYVGCCNPASKGGECTTSNVPLSFDFQYVVPTPTPTPRVTSTPAPTPVCLAKDAACTDYSKCCSKVCSSGKCQGACSTEKPSASGQAYSGCTSSTPVCNASYICVQCTDTDSSFCKTGETCKAGVCTAQSCKNEGETPTDSIKCCTGLVPDSGGKCAKEAACKNTGEAYTSTAPCCTGLLSGSDGTCKKATACTKDSQCASGEYCDIEQAVCVKTPYADSNTIRFDFESEKFTNHDGTAVSGVTLGVSSIIPVAGFVLTLDNTKTGILKSASFKLDGITAQSARVGVFYLNGTSVKSLIYVPPSAQVDVIVTYPDVRPESFNGDVWGVNAGFSKDTKGSLHFSASDATLMLMGSFSGGNKDGIPFSITPNVIDTDAYTAGLAVFDTTHNQFLPMEPSSPKKYDAYYENPNDGEAYSMYLFNNNLLSKKLVDEKETSKQVYFGFSDSEAASKNPAAKPAYEVYSGFQETPSGMAVDKASLYKPLRVMPVFSTTNVMRSFDIDRVNLMTQTGGGSSTAVTHDWMRQKLNSALQELYNLKSALTGKTFHTPKKVSSSNEVEPMVGETVNVLRTLHLGNGNLFGAKDDPATPEVESAGRLDDIFISAVEASTMRIIWFKYNPTYVSFESPVDITGTYEYPSSAYPKVTDLKIIPNTNLPSAPPSPKELSAYPGQKRNTAYFCAASTDPADCPKAKTVYTALAVPDYFGAKSITNLYALTGSYSGSDAYSNPASGVSEENPQQVCQMKMARNGVCVGSGNDACFLAQSGEIVYVFDSKTRAYGWLNQPMPPAGKSCAFGAGAKGTDCYACYYGNHCEIDFSTESVDTYTTQSCPDPNSKTSPTTTIHSLQHFSVPGECSSLNYNGLSDSNGYAPYALLHPDRRCYWSDYVNYAFTFACPTSRCSCPAQSVIRFSNTKCVSCSDIASGLDLQGSFNNECDCCYTSSPLRYERKLSDDYPVQCERQSILQKGSEYMRTQVQIPDGTCPLPLGSCVCS